MDKPGCKCVGFEAIDEHHCSPVEVPKTRIELVLEAMEAIGGLVAQKHQFDPVSHDRIELIWGEIKEIEKELRE